jgi:carbon storage regulator
MAGEWRRDVLVLARHVDEEIVINPGMPDEVVIVVVGIRGDSVRLGIAAPPEVVVHRREVVEAIERKRRA